MSGIPFTPYYVYQTASGVWCVIDRTGEDKTKKPFDDKATADAVAKLLNTQWRIEMGFPVN